VTDRPGADPLRDGGRRGSPTWSRRGSIETFELRVVDVGGVTRGDHEFDPTVAVAADEITVDFELTEINERRGVDDAGALINFVEGTYVQGSSPATSTPSRSTGCSPRRANRATAAAGSRPIGANAASPLVKYARAVRVRQPSRPRGLSHADRRGGDPLFPAPAEHLVGAIVYTLVLTPMLLLISMLVFTGVLNVGTGINLGSPTLVVGLLVALPVVLGAAIDYLYVPPPDDVELPDTN